jgi:hypothetical protein
MRSAFNYVVTPLEERTTSVKTNEGKQLILNTDLQNHQFVSREAKVISIPLFLKTELQDGDTAIVHHNVFRRFYDVYGKEKWSKSYLFNDKWLAQHDQIYAYKRNGEWKATKGFCFVKPVKNTDGYKLGKEKPLTGILVYIDETLKENGLKPGDLISFKPGSEYEFVIEGKRLYRVPINFITIKYEHRGNEEEYYTSWEKSS